MVDAVLDIMQKAVVPWSIVVEKLVQQYLEMDGPKYVYIVLSFTNFYYDCKSLKLFPDWYIPQTRAFKGELPSDGNQETPEKLWDPQLQLL